MRPAIGLAQTLLSAGEPVFAASHGCWKLIGRFSIQSMTGALPVAPTLQEVQGILLRSGRLVALYPSREATAQPLLSFVARREGHGPLRQQRQFRQKLRSGLRFSAVGPLSWQELEREGLAVNRAAVAARRSNHHSWCRPERWRRFCRAMAKDPQMAVWGCRVEGRLAAFLLLWQCDRMAHGLALQWDPALAWAHPTHCLYDGVLSGLFERCNIDAVGVGRQTIPARPALDRFKRHAGFVPEPCPVRVVAHPWLAPWLRGRGIASLRHQLASTGQTRWSALAHLEVLARACEPTLP